MGAGTKSYISQIQLPGSETTDWVKDSEAREAIASLNSFEYQVCTEASNTPKDVVWGDPEVTGTLVASADTMNKIYLVPSVNGTKDVYDEYLTIKTGSGTTATYSWEMFGNTDVHMSDLGALAKKDSASGSFTPAGTVSQPTFEGSSMTSTGSVTATGTVSQPTFTGSSGSLSVSGTPAGSIGIGDGSANYTPAGTVAAPTVTVTPTSATKYVATSATSGGSVTAGSAASCTLPTLSTTVNGEKMTLAWTDGSFTANTPTAVTLPAFESATVVSGIESAEASAPAFTGTGVQLTFSGNTMTSTGSFTPEGTVSQPTFSGESVSVSVTGTPEGTVSQPTFSGTAGTVTVS